MILEKLDGLLDRLTMYKLLLYYLIGLLGVAIALCVTGQLHSTPFDIAGSAIFLVLVCWTTNQIFSQFLQIPANGDSTHITALILALIITPGLTQDNILFMLMAGVLAISSKYLITIKGKHLFNPAAFAVLLTAYAANHTASWWVGNLYMAPFVIIGGLLLMRRIRRTSMVSVFFATSLIASAVYALIAQASVSHTIHAMIFESAMLFMGFVMLTEPQTSPGTKQNELRYSVLTGLLFSPRIHLGSIFSTPELVLCIGNIYAFLVNPQVKLMPKFNQKIQITPDTYEFQFDPGKKFNFKPGQYMEFTLPHEGTDLRGQRRYFTIASAPTESTLRIGVKFYPNSSSFKKSLFWFNKQTLLSATNLGGDFTLPKNKQQRLVFIAGGIGVTPYRSMIKYMLDFGEKRPVTLLYSANTAADIAYMDIFEQARAQLGIDVFYNLTVPNTPLPDARYQAGVITPELLKKQVPEFQNALFYVSGPHGMVVAIEKALSQFGVPRRNIKTDFFSGYA